MLKPNSDRLDYGELMAPPEGYELISAIGTTYSLDFDALVGVCIALGLSESTDSAILNNPVYLLETLQKTGDKVALFCEAGQIHAPTNNSSLYILLEKIVYEVAVKKQSSQPKYPSFHPKFWLIKYADKNGSNIYRVVVLSRNLTFDRSWDVAISMDGKPVKRVSKQSKPLIDFLNYLLGSLNGSDDNVKAKRKLIREMMRDIERVEFKSDIREFEDIEFIPVGVANEAGKYKMADFPLFSDTFHEALIMSPFLSDGVIEEFNNRNKNIENPVCTLITRRSSLEKLKAEHCDRFKIYTLKDTVVDGETIISDEQNEIRKQDIHAKLYLWRKYSDSELYLGSLNASYSALSGNIEFMVRLKSKNRYINTEMLLKSLFGGAPDNPDNPFESATLPIEISYSSDLKDELENKLKMLAREKCQAEVKKNGDKYDLIINFEKLTDYEGIAISPLLSNKSSALMPVVKIEELGLLQLSEFYKISAKAEDCEVQRVIKIPTANMPPDRESAVVKDIIKDQQCFFQYIAFLLGDDYLISAIETQSLKNSGFYKNGANAQMPALYERMLRTAAEAPERFAEIDYLVRMVTDDGIVPEGFFGLYDKFRKAVGTRA